MLINILIQPQRHWGRPKHGWHGVYLHYVIATGMLCESHTASTYPYVWRRWCVRVRDHVHRLRASALAGKEKKRMANGYYKYGPHFRYQQFFGYLDDWRAALCQQL